METSTSRPDRRMLLAATALGAAAIHLALVPAHAAEWVPLAVAFAGAAWAQGALGVAALLRPSASVRWGLAVVSATCVAAWAVSRTVGLPVGPEAWTPETVSVVDLLCVALELTTLAVLLLPARRLVARRTPSWLGGISVAAVAVVTTAVLVSPSAAEHGHEHVTTEAIGHVHTDQQAVAPGHTHDSTAAPSIGTSTATHLHGAADASDATSTSLHDHPVVTASPDPGGVAVVHDHGTTAPAAHDPHAAHDAPVADGTSTVVSGPHHHAACTDPVTAEQQAAADRFAAASDASLARWADLSAATADGFVPFTPVGQPLVHYGNRAWMNDGHTLDSNRPESLVYAFPKQGPAILLGAMYMAEPGETGPQIGGCGTQWHDHTNLCLSDRGGAMVGVVDAAGSCPAGSSNRVTGEMLHVWDLPLAAGPYSEATPAQLRDAVIAKLRSGR